ncbi:hypothetical protein [Pontibacter cellulosilyticus]|uniref:Uncharacterized protein n=1 Tax=Pontibacter cellulosilyticus TaxID=1720253 RepID=A0A923N9B8_9BACT|nr:hypothetical protein [Pontibacter cellulosilyticus]MBC5994167.1 hypothetical protein [Pontibacter cellulosilyticus]
MTKSIFPAIAVFLTAICMHLLRDKHVEVNVVLSLALLYAVGMVAGAILNTLKEDPLSL